MSNLGARGGRIITSADPARAPMAAPKRGKRFSRDRVRLSEDERKRLILDAAMRLLDSGKLLVELKWENVANECSVRTSIMTARRAFDKSVVALRRAAAERGRSEGKAGIVEQGVRYGFLTG